MGEHELNNVSHEMMNYSLAMLIKNGIGQAWNILCVESQQTIQKYIDDSSYSPVQKQVILDYCSIASSIMLYDVELSTLHYAYSNTTSEIEKRILQKEYNAITYTLYRYWFAKNKQGKYRFDKYRTRLLELAPENNETLVNLHKAEKDIRKSFVNGQASNKRNMTYHYSEEPDMFTNPSKMVAHLLSLNLGEEGLQRTQLLSINDKLLETYSRVNEIQQFIKVTLLPIKPIDIATIKFFNQVQTDKLVNSIRQNAETQWSLLVSNKEHYDLLLNKKLPRQFSITEHRRIERLFRFVMQINLLYLDLATFFKSYLISPSDYERWFFIYRLNVSGYEGVSKLSQLIDDFVNKRDCIMDDDIVSRIKQTSTILSLLKFNKQLRNAFVDFQSLNKGQEYVQNMRSEIAARQVCVLICLLLPELNNLLWAMTAYLQAISQEIKKQTETISTNIKVKIQEVHPLLLQFAKSKQQVDEINSVFNKLSVIAEL